MRWRLSPKAAEDLEALGDFIAKDDPVAAIRFIDRIHERLQAPTAVPESGARRDDIRPGLRMILVGRYLILYRMAEMVEVIRIVHGHRRITSDDA